jgi:hypothetical protein
MGNRLRARTQTKGPKIQSEIAFHSFMISLSLD